MAKIMCFEKLWKTFLDLGANITLHSYSFMFLKTEDMTKTGKSRLNINIYQNIYLHLSTQLSIIQINNRKKQISGKF